MAKPIEITIGAAFAGSFAKTITGAQNTLQRLGSTISRLGNAQSGVSQMQSLSNSANSLGRAYAAAKKHANELREAIAGIENPSKAQIREFQRADAATEKARLALDRQREALRTLKTELQAAGVNTKSLTSESLRLVSSWMCCAKKVCLWQKRRQPCRLIASGADKLWVTCLGCLP